MSASPGAGGRTPVLVGVAATAQREPDFRKAREPIALMTDAMHAAAADAGSPELLARIDHVMVPRGMWAYPDPARRLAEAAGAQAKTLVAQVGVLQTTLLAEAGRAIARGEADVVLIAGGEAKFREQQARRAGSPEGLTGLDDARVPDRVLRPHDEILSPEEMAAGVAMPVAQYAMADVALRQAEGQTVADQRDEIAGLWARMSEVAAANPAAWQGEAVSAEHIRDESSGNRMLAFPYTKLHNSQWHVDQAAALLLCSLETARALGIARDRMVFPLAVAESNHMLNFTARKRLHRVPGFAHAAERALADARRDLADAAHLELYSCFPAAVRIQQRELGLDRSRDVTVTGGMTFAGGPFNNFVLQAWVRMAQVLREDPGSLGLVTAVSGMLTKQGVTLWSTEPGPGFAASDVSAAVAPDIEAVPVVSEAAGTGRIATYTAHADGQGGAQAVLLCDLDAGGRVLLRSPDPELAQRAVAEDLYGRTVRLATGRDVEVDS